jgi:uroporphyrinogen III methyltransferase / synthase
MKESGRLNGKTILITRAKEQAKTLTSLLRKEGASVLGVPTIQIILQPEELLQLEKAMESPESYAWLVLTSVNTVSIVDSLIQKRNRDWRHFDRLQIACIGESTAERVRQVGGKVALVPPQFQAESLAEELLKTEISGKRILLPRAAGSRTVLPTVLSASGAIVDEIRIYRADLPESSRSKLIRILEEEQVDFITFTSSSTVRNFMELAGDVLSNIDLERTLVACIGPITASTLREYGVPVTIQATEFTIPGLVSAIIQHLESN